MDILKELRQRHLEHLIKEAVVTVIAEQHDLQAQQAQAVPPPPPVTPDQTIPEQQPQDPQVSDVNTLTVDSLIERLNVIRGGKSFTDPQVYDQMTAYYEKLPPEEKEVLERNLTELGKVVIAANNTQQQPTQPNPQQAVQAPPQGALQAPPPPPAGGPITPVR